MVKASFYTLKMKMYQIKIYWMAWYEYMLYDRNTTCVGRGFVDLAMALLVFLYNNVYICFLGGYFYYYQKWTILSPCLTRGRKRTGGIKRYYRKRSVSLRSRVKHGNGIAQFFLISLLLVGMDWMIWIGYFKKGGKSVMCDIFTAVVDVSVVNQC